MIATSSRRAVLKAAPVIAAGIAIPSAAATLRVPEREAWDEAFAAHERAKAEDAAFDPIYASINAAWERGRPSMDDIHWSEFPFRNRNEVARTLDLEAAWLNFLDGEEKWWWGDSENRKARYRAALDSVRAFRDAEAQHDRGSGMTEADERWESLGSAVADTRSALMDLPAPDLAALAWKLAQLREDDGSLIPWEPEYIQQTFADIDRLLPAGA